MSIRAAVVDLRGHDPKAGDVFLVDSNVWIRLASTRFIEPRWKDYPQYVKKAHKSKATLLASSINFAEVAKYIERLPIRCSARTHAWSHAHGA